MKRRPQRYPSDLTEREWKILKPLLPRPGANQKNSQRRIIDSLLYLDRTGCQWRWLPHDYPAWPSVYYHFAKWTKQEVWERINTALVKLDRQQRGRTETPSGALIDSQSVKTSKEAGHVGFDGGKMVKGHKRHSLADTLGNMLKVVVTAANISDIAGAKLVITNLADVFSTIEKIWADGGYRGNLIGWVQETLAAVLEIVSREPGQKGFKVQPKRWVIERTFAWLGNYRRLSKDYERLLPNSEAMIYLASINTMLRRIAR